jgi:ABC-2 type transport system ATP-binding protein
VSNAVEITQLRVAFGDVLAVEDVTLRVDYGEVVTLLGPNGAGKTTTVETLLGLRSPTSGTVRLGGLDPVRDHREVVARTGALLQRGGVWSPMSPAQVLRLTASYYDAPRDTGHLLEQLDLARAASTPWRRLSGGEQQRTLLALSLVGRPRILVLDEPTSSVDPEGRQVIRDLIASERGRGCALLITTHELNEAERLSDRLCILNAGHVVAQGTLEELAGEPEIIVETSAPVPVSRLAAIVGGPVVAEGPTVLRCAVAPSPLRMAAITDFLASEGVALVSLRTRASLEERYLELIASDRSRSPS